MVRRVDFALILALVGSASFASQESAREFVSGLTPAARESLLKSFIQAPDDTIKILAKNGKNNDSTPGDLSERWGS